MFPSKLVFYFSLSITLLCLTTVESTCANTTCLALGTYYVWSGASLTLISSLSNYNNNSYILSYNPQITNESLLQDGSRINIPFSCGCIHNEFLGHVFQYTILWHDSYEMIANTYYSSLTTTAMLEKYNSYNATDIPNAFGYLLNVTVTCSCGNTSVSDKSAVFVTYPLQVEDSLQSVAANWSVSTDLLEKYNPGVDFSSGSGIVYIPDYNASSLYSATSPDIAQSYQTQKSSSGTLSAGLKAGISIGAVMGILLVAVCIYCAYYKQKGKQVKINVSKTYEDLPLQADLALGSKSDSIGTPGSASPGRLNFSMDKWVGFSKKELVDATNDFSDDHKIGQGAFGAVYSATLQGQKTAIKKMDVTTSNTKQFYAELQILTQVNHVNLVCLIGYCVEDSLFLVYEHIENGDLSEHLHGAGRDPLSWTRRLQIALDSARGLEYIHEYARPVYVHRDVKPANILIDESAHAKVADFGLTKLHEVVNSIPTYIGGTPGYMAPESQYGEVSPKGDVYAFGVVLYELISAKRAVIKSSGSTPELKFLGSLFEEAFSKPDPKESIRELIDPRLGDNYPLDLILELAQLAKTCTQVDPEKRPCMKFVAVDLMRISASTVERRNHFMSGGQNLN